MKSYTSLRVFQCQNFFALVSAYFVYFLVRWGYFLTASCQSCWQISISPFFLHTRQAWAKLFSNWQVLFCSLLMAFVSFCGLSFIFVFHFIWFNLALTSLSSILKNLCGPGACEDFLVGWTLLGWQAVLDWWYWWHRSFAEESRSD